MNIVIVDDDDYDASQTQTMIHEFFAQQPKESVSLHYSITRFTNGDDLLENYESGTDVVFLDIEMPGTNGVDIARKLRTIDTKVVLIFTTKMAQYATEGYDVDATGYLVKPFTQNAFNFKMAKVIKRIQHMQTRYIPIDVEEGIRVLNAEEIEYIDVVKHKVTYHCEGFNITVWSSLKEVLQTLENVGLLHSFEQINRYTIVNLAKVTAVYTDQVKVGESSIGISRSRRKNFMVSLTQYHGATHA
ncbi:LytR/AlgR family response regulator transcription factor [Alloscardovia omnicolens]|uniref:LytR/AlgR family response regulator transcription factor n=1 Tax=Alloscardovia omnicolens TaxID=419015 RepID=UPI003A6EC2AC